MAGVPKQKKAPEMAPQVKPRSGKITQKGNGYAHNPKYPKQS